MKVLCCIGMLFNLCLLPIAIQAKELNSLYAGLNRLLSQIKTHANIGITIAQVDTGKVLYAVRSSYLYSPASSQKLFTAVAALHYLGPDFHFDTSLLTNGNVADHTLRGDLTVRFSGDPELTENDLSALIGQLKSLGIRQIDGRVYIDNSDYNPVPYPPGWLWDDLSYGYAAPLNAVIINRNKFILHLAPAKKLYASPELQPEVTAGVVQFVNQAQTIAHHDKECPLIIYSDISNRYRVAGCIPRAWGKQRRTLAIRDPVIYARVLIEQALKNNHIAYQNPISLRNTPVNAVVLARHSSPPLRNMLREMLKNSDNLTTDSLLKKMGQLYSKRQGSWQNGLYALKKILSPTGINFKLNRINDGAGLSRYNLITPDQFSQLLYFAYHDRIIRDALWTALPIAGKDGTLAGRMYPAAAGERVHAKTGAMAGVTALAGFVKTKHHGILSFAIMINGFVGKNRPFNRLQDHICEFLIHNG